MKTFLDGNMYCCIDNEFENLQESSAGFGETPEQSFIDYCKKTNKQLWAAFSENDLISFGKSKDSLKAEENQGLNIVEGLSK